MEIALASRSLAPFGGGGIGEYVDTTARLLGRLGRVTLFTTDSHRPAYDALRAAGDPDGLLAPDAEYHFVPEPPGPGGYYSELHRYGADLLDAIVARHPGGPDLLEVSDYLGEGFVPAQARSTGDPRLGRTRLAVRLHSTSEICSVLNGHLADDFGTTTLCEMERFALRHADRLLWPGGDVLDLYARFYGADRLAPAERIRNPLAGDVPAAAPVARLPGSPLRALYLGRLERRKGVHNLVRAVGMLGADDLRLTLLGGDTQTAPLGASMRSYLELMADEDPRIAFADPVSRRELSGLIAAHDVVVLPSLWECWPYVGLEAMRMNRPVLATPTGGFTELVEPGVNGWLTRDASPEAIVDALAELVHGRDGDVPALARAGGPRRTAEALAGNDEILAAYERLLDARPPARVRAHARGGAPALVSVIVPYFGMAAFVEDTVRSVFAQTHPRLEVIVVDDGSFAEEDWMLAELVARYPVSVVTQPNSGLGAARNFGVSQARGRYVLPLDADNMIEPSFVERCLDVLESDPAVAYVTTWSRFVDETGRPLPDGPEGYQPIGNDTDLILRDNVAGDAAAVIRRRIFDLGFAYDQELTSYEDWQFYRRLHAAGRHGRVIPQRLLRYRVRGDSMIREVGLPHTGRLFDEMRARTREREVAWTSRSA